MMRRPPGSPRFPCTTLFRSPGRAGARRRGDRRRPRAGAAHPPPLRGRVIGYEEIAALTEDSQIGRAHVELQSRQYTVCRPLLEKINNLALPPHPPPLVYYPL